jgi:hypothetical protein
MKYSNFKAYVAAGLTDLFGDDPYYTTLMVPGKLHQHAIVKKGIYMNENGI